MSVKQVDDASLRYIGKAVDRLDMQVDGVDAFGLSAPIGRDHALGVARAHVAEVGAIDAVDGNTLAAGDEAGDCVGRNRLEI